MQAVKLQQFFGQSTKGTETEIELGRRRSRSRRSRTEEEAEADAEAEEEEEKKKKNQKGIPASICNPAETGRNFGRGGTWECLVPICMPVRDFPSVPAETERNIQHW